MKNGDDLLKELYSGRCINDCLIVGEAFYIQLFINFNIFCLKDIRIYHNSRCFWSSDMNLIYISQMHQIKNDELIIYCGFDKQEKEKYLGLIDYDFFNMDSIRKDGTFNYKEQTYIVDDVKYVASNPEYMKRAYKDIKPSDLYHYLQELAKEPAGRRVDLDGKICLWDYNGQFIHHKNGRRITIDAPHCADKRIHIFGDSRVSGYMLEDKDLFSNLLQHKVNDAGLNMEIINYGIPGREVDRMEVQVKQTNFQAGDLVFVMTACYEYREKASEKQQQFALHMRRIKTICDIKQVKLCYINLPVTVEMVNPSVDEQTITELYRNYKFNEYTTQIIEHYKIYLFRLLSEYGIWYYDLANDFNRPHDDLLFINMHHYSPAGNMLICDTLFRLISAYSVECDQKVAQKLYVDAQEKMAKYVANEHRKYSPAIRTHVQLKKGNTCFKHLCFRLWIWIQGFLKEIRVDRIRKNHDIHIGAIVMNANPFTLGHRYLVEYASQRVKYLYVFVLEEEKSEISYDDRLHMVYLGISDLKNVTVTSGGRNIISSDTFPEYFMKEELQDAEINAYKDIESFALKIAPLYGITDRFFGEEPIDNVTRQYNEQMKLYLPEFYINAVEIPRKKDETGVISASRVRCAIEEKNWGAVSKLVPKTTLKYLKKMNCDKRDN